MQWRSLFSFDITSDKPRLTTKEIEIPLMGEQNDYPEELHSQMVKLGDVAYQPIPVNQKSFRHSIRKTTRSFGFIHPQTTWLLFWNLLMGLVVLYNFVQIPLRIFITKDANLTPQELIPFHVIDAVLLTILLIDLVAIRWRIGWYSNQGLQSDPYSLLLRSFQGQFWVDFVGFVVYLLSASIRHDAHYVKVIFYAKSYTWLQVDDLIQEGICSRRWAVALYRFLRMVAFIYCVTSAIACVYFAIDFNYYKNRDFYYQNGYLWLTGSSTTDYMDLITTFPWYIWYEYALYWIVQTVATVGYGNMTPRNPNGVLLCNFAMLTCICLFILFANTVFEIVYQFQSNTKMEQQQLANLHRLNKIHQIPVKTINPLENHIKQSLKAEKDPVSEISGALSESLQVQLVLAFRPQLIQNIPLLRNLSQDDGQWNDFAKKVVTLVQTKNCWAGEKVVQNLATSDFNLWMVESGRVRQRSSISDEEMEYQQFDYFGQTHFFFSGKASAEVVSVSYAKLIYLSREDFMKTIKDFKRPYQQYLQVSHSALHCSGSSQAFGIECANCQKPHLPQCCPLSSEWRSSLGLCPLTPQSQHKRSYFPRRKQQKSRRERKVRGLMLENDRNIWDKACNFDSYFPYVNLSSSS